MHHKTYLLRGADLTDPVTRLVQNYFCEESDTVYESTYEGGYLLAFEDYSWLNGNAIMVCIRVNSTRAASGEVEIEILSGGANSSMLQNVDWGSEKRRIKRFEKELMGFCKEMGVDVGVVREG